MNCGSRNMSWLRVREPLVKALNVDRKKEKKRRLVVERCWALQQGTEGWGSNSGLSHGIPILPISHDEGTITVDVETMSTTSTRWLLLFPSLIRSLSEAELPGVVVLLFVLISRVARRFSASPRASLHPAERKKLIMNS